MAGPDRSIFQIDVFKREAADEVALVTSSGGGRLRHLGQGDRQLHEGQAPGGAGEPEHRSKAWKFYLPIANPNPHKPPLGLIRTYCDLEHWETVWEHNLKNTYVRLPFVLLGEFILLWVILATVVTEPIRTRDNHEIICNLSFFTEGNLIAKSLNGILSLWNISSKE